MCRKSNQTNLFFHNYEKDSLVFSFLFQAYEDGKVLFSVCFENRYLF